MNQWFRSLVLTFALLAAGTFAATTAYAQGGATASLSGTVTDSSGAVIPGATVTVKSTATSAEFTAVTSDQGTFTIPALNAGRYSVTVTLMGFKTVVLNDVELNAGVPRAVKATLEAGGVEETIQVHAGAEIVQTQSSTVSTTISANQMVSLPLTSRNALDFITFLPGVNSPGTNRNSTVSGLPQAAINITLDGMNIQDNYLKTTDGFYARVSPRLDAVEEVTVTTAANGADSGAQGAVNIRFITRSGTNDFRGSAYEYYRRSGLNANLWFNNRDLAVDPATNKAPRTELKQDQPGFRAGGPIMIPGLWSGRDKAFYFVNYEQFRQPQKITRSRTILSPEAQLGIFRYNTSSGVRQVNLLELAASNNQLATVDPTVTKLLSDIRGTTALGQVAPLTDPNQQRFTFQLNAKSLQHYPTGRVDVNVTKNNRLTGSGTYQSTNSDPDLTNDREPVFPGFPNHGSQTGTRWTTSEALRTTLGANLVNEARFGATGGSTNFSPEVLSNGVSMFRGTPIADQGGFALSINAVSGLSNPTAHSTPSAREASTKVLEDTLTWLRGKHSVSMGGSFTQGDVWLKNQTVVPTISFGVINTDPALAMFTGNAGAQNFQGASSTQLTAAQNLYAVLTGRVSSIAGNARLNESTGQYEFLGLGVQRARLREMDFFAQDQWRWRSNITVNYGLRYVVQYPFYPMNDSYTTATIESLWGVSGVGNLFKPNVLTGQPPVFVQFGKGEPGYRTDWNNFAPSIGFTYVPTFSSGMFRGLFGAEGDTVFKGGYAIAYERPGMSDFTGVFGANPGVTINANRSVGLNNLVGGSLGSAPLLLRESPRLGPPSFASAPVYPMTDVITEDVNIFEPNLQVPYSESWTAGMERKITRDMAVAVRYVGTRHLQGWTAYNFNEANIVDNGFLDEFRLAQQNLRANIAAGRGNTFAYFGQGTGTNPLPIYLAYFAGLPRDQALDATKYVGVAQFASSNFYNALAIYNPNPFIPAGTNANTGLDGDAARRANAARAGLPVNFFRANPDLQGGANLTGNGGYTSYDSFQLELKKRLSHGLQFQTSYAYGPQYLSNRYSLRKPRVKNLDAGTEGTVFHAFKANWVYELPFGHGRRFGSNVGGLLDRIIGGWEFDGTSRIQTGTTVDLGNVRVVGMSTSDVKKLFKLRFDDEGKAIYMWPQDIIDNTVRAFSTSPTSATGYSDQGAPTGRYFAPANGPDCIETALATSTNPTTGFGDCGVRQLIVQGPPLARFDLSAVKRIQLVGRTTFEFRAEFLNAFNSPWFTPVSGFSSGATATGGNQDDFRVTALNGEDRSRTIQLVTRFSW